MTAEERDRYIANIVRENAASKGSHRTWTETDKEMRDECLYYEMGQGKSYAKIAAELSERWGCKQTTIYRYLTDARKRLAKINREKADEYRTKMIEKLERLANDALRHGDRKSALAAYDQISKLQGAYTNKVEADVKADITFDFGE